MSGISDFKRVRPLRKVRKNSVSDSNLPVKEKFSSVNSSRFGDSEDSNSIGMS